ncbi:hypothetical protein LENED_009459 [Lentinula edodes]|uniref:Uncharacterized protein n=1 Tax=Lentinula edodes TaxID=5353 RepID=A0A1Q3EJW2_LENED|nr:hypothetical protein LENED_009459 [Lentinula edodes]
MFVYIDFHLEDGVDTYTRCISAPQAIALLSKTHNEFLEFDELRRDLMRGHSLKNEKLSCYISSMKE